MCIAAIINKPVPLAHLKIMEKDNPHGAGLAWFTGTTIRFKRGLTAKQIHRLQTTKSVSYPYLLHFRWATHGAKVPQLAHPFPTGPRALHGELEGEARQVLIHNGVWNECVKWESLIDATKAQIDATSDTGIMAYIVGALDYPDLLHEVPWAVALATLVNGNMEITKYGRTWQGFEGNEYSNLYWLPNDLWWTYNKDCAYAKSRRTSYYSGWDWESDGSGTWTFGQKGTCITKTAHSSQDSQDSQDSQVGQDSATTYEEWWAEKMADEARDRARQAENKAASYRLSAMSDQEWEDYVRARYGHSTADEGAETPEGEDDGMELVSEEYDKVNAWIASQESKGRKAG